MNEIQTYFSGERWQCSIGAFLAVICMIISAYFISLNYGLSKGIAFATIPLSFFLLVICAGIIVRTPKDIERVSQFYNSEKQKLQTEELPRMQRVMKTFSLIKNIETGMFIFGLLLAVFFWKNDLTKGIAIGLMLQCIIFYVFDSIAEYRAKPYLMFLENA